MPRCGCLEIVKIFLEPLTELLKCCEEMGFGMGSCLNILQKTVDFFEPSGTVGK